MKTSLLIETAHTGVLFSTAYLLAFMIAAGIMIFMGMKKGYPPMSYFLIMASGVVFFIIGDKMFTWSQEQWINALTRFEFPESMEKNALGGIIGMLAGIFIAKAALRFNRPVFDHLAVALPLALAVSRIGCLMAGCCFGTPTSLFAGIRYDAGSLAWQSQVIQGLISDNDQCSLAVHPVQLYQFAGCLLIVFIVWHTRNRWRSNGSLFLFSVLCYGFMRFFVEFLCDPLSGSFAAPLLWKMNLVQWLIIISFIPGLITLIIREAKTKTQTTKSLPFKASEDHVSEYRQLAVAILLSVIMIRGRSWFDHVEYITMLIFCIPPLALLIKNIYRNHTVAGFRWVVPVLLLCCISFMGQKSEKTGSRGDQVVFTDIGLIGSLGSYCESISTISQEWVNDYYGGGCIKSVGSADHWVTHVNDNGYSSRSFWQSGLEISRNRWRGKYNKFQVGARGFYGYESGSVSTDYPHPVAAGISPFINFDWHYFGFGTGFSAGQMLTSYQTPLGKKDFTTMSDGDVVATNYYNAYFLPSLSLRAGPVDIIYAEACFPGTFPSAIPFATIRAGVGSGLGKANGTKLAIGYCSGLYAQFVYPVKNKFVVNAEYCDNLSGGQNERRFFTLGFHFRIFKQPNTAVPGNSNIQ